MLLVGVQIEWLMDCELKSPATLHLVSGVGWNFDILVMVIHEHGQEVILHQRMAGWN